MRTFTDGSENRLTEGTDRNSTTIESGGTSPETPAGGASTTIESAGPVPPPQRCGARASGQRPARKLTLGGKTYSVVRPLKVVSSEADLFLVTGGDAKRYILKQYRFNIQPKEDIIRKLGSLSREDVIELVDSGTGPDGRFYEIQEYAEFGSLEDHIKTGFPFSPPFIRSLVRELVACLREIHSKNIIHRDIKPSNILIRTLEPLDLVLTDFGISSLTELSLHQTSLSATITYSSPEAITGIISKAVDYWAVGMILYEMLAGRHPFAGMDDRAVLYTLATKEVPGLSDVSGEFAPLLGGLLVRDARLRWGYQEVTDWLDGKSDVSVRGGSATDTGEQRTARPYRFGGNDYYALPGLMAAMAADFIPAVREFSERRVRDWIGKDLLDRRNLEIIDSITSDASRPVEEQFFDFYLETCPEPAFYFCGYLVDRDSLASLARSVVAGSAPDIAKKALYLLISRKIFVKYYEFVNDPDTYERDFKKACEECYHFDSAEAFARVILINLQEGYADELAVAVSDVFDRAVLVEPAPGFRNTGEMTFRAYRITREGNRDTRELVRMSMVPRSCYKTRAEIDELLARARAKYARLFPNEAEGGGPELRWDPFEKLSDAKPLYTSKFYGKLTAYIARLDAFAAGNVTIRRAESEKPVYNKYVSTLNLMTACLVAALSYYAAWVGLLVVLLARCAYSHHRYGEPGLAATLKDLGLAAAAGAVGGSVSHVLFYGGGYRDNLYWVYTNAHVISALIWYCLTVAFKVGVNSVTYAGDDDEYERIIAQESEEEKPSGTGFFGSMEMISEGIISVFKTMLQIGVIFYIGTMLFTVVYSVDGPRHLFVEDIFFAVFFLMIVVYGLKGFTSRYFFGPAVYHSYYILNITFSIFIAAFITIGALDTIYAGFSRSGEFNAQWFQAMKGIGPAILAGIAGALAASMANFIYRSDFFGELKIE